MKAFIAALVLLAILIGIVTGGSILLSASTQALSEQAMLLSEKEGREEQLAAFEKAWDAKRAWYMLVLNTNEIGKVDEAVAEVRASLESKSDSDYAIAVAELQEACSHMHELVGFRIEQIF